MHTERRTTPALLTAFALLGGTAALADGAVIETRSNPVPDGSIVIDSGGRTDWAAVPSYTPDEDEGVSNDWKSVSLAHDSSNLYIRYQTHRTDNFGGFLSQSQYTFIDTDRSNATGFHSAWFDVGADYMLENFTLFKHAGGGNGWNWVSLGSVSYQDWPLNDTEFALPLTLLGNPQSFDFALYAHGVDGSNSFAVDVYANQSAGHFAYAVPEPVSLAWIGVAGLLATRRRSKPSA